MTERYYSSSAGKMILQVGVSALGTALQVDTTVGLPGSTPYTLLVDVGLPNEEIVTVTQVSGTILTVTRGEDGSSAQPHSNGAVIRHAITARDLRDSRDHENATSGVHGVTGPLAGTTATQTLTNKNLTSPTNTFPSSLATDAELTAHSSATAAHGATGAVVGTTNTQTLTGKTIQGGVATPTSASTVAWTVKGAVNQVEDLQRWTDSASTTRARVDDDGSFVNTQAGTVGALLNSASAAPSGSSWHYLGSGAVDKNVLNLNAPTGLTAKLLSARVNGVEVMSVDSDGSITAPNLPANIPGTSTTKNEKRVHWGYTSVTTTGGSATATVTHGAGFTPQVVIVQGVDVTWRILVDTFTATTFRVRTFDGNGNSFPLSGVTIAYFCGE